MTRAHSKSILVFLSIFALILLGLFSFGIYQIRADNTETTGALSIANEVAQKEILMESIRELRASSEEELVAFEEIALTESELVPVIESIESAGKALRLELKIVSVDKAAAKAKGSKAAKEKSDQQGIRIVVESDGAWADNFSFLRALESLPHKKVFESVHLSKKEERWHSEIAFSLLTFDN